MSVLLAMLALAAGPDGHDPRHAGHHQGCRTRRCDARMARKAHGKTVRRWRRTVAPHDAYLIRIARCESGLRWTIATGNGYYGGLQFSLRSWAAVGGSGLPHHASPLEQKYRAIRLSRLQGWGAWPRCRYA